MLDNIAPGISYLIREAELPMSGYQAVQPVPLEQCDPIRLDQPTHDGQRISRQRILQT
jgi:hypothetical protein